MVFSHRLILDCVLLQKELFSEIRLNFPFSIPAMQENVIKRLGDLEAHLEKPAYLPSVTSRRGANWNNGEEGL